MTNFQRQQVATGTPILVLLALSFAGRRDATVRAPRAQHRPF
ncbi:hypothetical protein [Burkholderia plantarii]|nr:hypothetical protein [Burkholderia plantarii]